MLYLSYKAAPKKVALILHGCGVYDGSEITEAVSMLVHLDKLGTRVSVFAPDIKQVRVVDHEVGSEVEETRHVLVESARISRGSVLSLEKLETTKFDALFIPGGFGVANTLSDFGAMGANCTVLPDIDRVLNEFVDSKKPIGLCCIAPVLAARCIHGATVTMGKEQEEEGRWQNSGACTAIKEMGGHHEPRDITEICVDEEKKLVTAPAYMCSKASPSEVFDNIGQLVSKVISMIR